MQKNIKIKENLKLLLLLTALIYLNTAMSQSLKNLQLLKGDEMHVYFSAGHEQRAKNIAELTKNAIDYNFKLLGFKPKVNILVLSPEDWSQHTSNIVYGMPHYKNDDTLILASSDNALWKSLIPPIDQLPEQLAGQIQKAYKTPDGNLSMQPFFDLLALHELGHAFHIQGGLNMQRKWMGELFCNILLHTYIAEKQPSLLPALEIFPEMVVSAGSAEYEHTTLALFEKLYSNMDPRNYGWYQSRLHMSAKQIYNTGGEKVLHKLWNTLKQNRTKLDDAEFASFLQNKVHPAVANVMLQW